MAVELAHSLGGPNLSRAASLKGLEGEIRRMASERLISQVQRVRYPRYGQNARVTELRQARRGFTVALSDCCDALTERAERAIT